MQNNVSASHELRSSEGNARSDFPWWKWSRLGKTRLRNAKVAQKIKKAQQNDAISSVHSELFCGNFLVRPSLAHHSSAL
jgi:hypothetical protein